jgi:hypothetical protein
MIKIQKGHIGMQWIGIQRLLQQQEACSCLLSVCLSIYLSAPPMQFMIGHNDIGEIISSHLAESPL